MSLQESEPAPTTRDKQRRLDWLAWAVGSGAFAAFNGVFAKLTTADTTHGLAASISRAFGSSTSSPVLEVLFRGIFFGLNLLSNAVMWILFTRALTTATSSTRVAVLNTSANFMTTAILGMIVFGEKLPLLWWCGAALLTTGSVIIGARDGKEKAKVQHGDGSGDASTINELDNVGLDNADTVAVALGAGGVEQNVLDQGRFTDDADDADRSAEQMEYHDLDVVDEDQDEDESKAPRQRI